MIDVVAAVIQNDEGKILIAQRNLQKAQGGLWEFPGGKIESNETKEEAIVREIKEEMDIEIKVIGYIAQKIYNYPNKDINLIAMECKHVSGNIKLIEHEDIKWVNKNDLTKFNFAPADEFILKYFNKKKEPKNGNIQ